MRETAGDGFEVHGANGSFSKNKVQQAGDDGIWVAGDASGCMFVKNTATSNTSDGIQINGQDNAFIENTAKKNAGWDCMIFAPVGTNSFVGNNFGTVGE